MPKALDIKGVVAKYQEVKANTSGGGFIKLDKETTPLRLLTFVNPESDREELYVEFTSHFLGKGIGSIVCGNLAGDSCPICDYVDELLKSGEDTLANSIKAKSRYYFNAIEGDSGKVAVLECGPAVFKEITKYFNDPEFGNIADPTEGVVIKILRSGKGLNTEYSSTPSRKASPLPKGTEGKNLYELVDVKTTEELQAILDKNFETIKKNAAQSAASAEEEGPEEGEEERQARRTAEDSEPEEKESADKWKKRTFGEEKASSAKPEEEEEEKAPAGKQSDRVFGKRTAKPEPAPKPTSKATSAKSFPPAKKGGVVFGKKK